MLGVYDNGCTILGTIIDVKEYISRRFENTKDIIETLENYDANSIVTVEYIKLNNIISYSITKCWTKREKVESGWI